MEKLPRGCTVEDHNKFLDLWQECERDVVKAAVKAHIKKCLARGECDGAMARLAMWQFPDVFKPVEKPTAWVLVTIGAKDGIDPEKFIATMPNVMKKKGLEFADETQYVLEQRSEANQDPYGWHIHWLVKFVNPKSKSQRARLIYQGFGKYLAGQNYVDIKNVSEDRLEQVKRYIGGQKSEDKMAKVVRDRDLRKRMGIPDLFLVKEEGR